MFNKFFKVTIFLTIFLIAYNSNALDFDTKAEYAILIDDSSDTIIFEKNADIPTPPSSMSKLMTVYITFDHIKNGMISLNDQFKISPKAWKMQGSKTFVKVDQMVSVKDLLKGVIIQSGNDASVALAEGVAGSESAFTLEMTNYAEKLGLKHSEFKNATGWPDKGHVMSTRDLSILAHHLIHDFPEYYGYFSETEFSFNGIRQPNRNILLGKNLGVDGLKTGHTDVAGYGIVVSANRADRRLIAVVNGLNSEAERAEEIEKLLVYAYKNFINKQIFKAGDVVENAEIFFGNKMTLPLVAKDNINVTLPRKVDTENTEIFVRYNGPIPAPIAKDAQIADLVIKTKDYEKTFPLYAGEEIHKLKGIRYMLRSIHHYLQ